MAMGHEPEFQSHNGLNGQRGESLFAKLVALGYEDGPTGGAIQSTDGRGDYRFELVAIDVDGIHDYDAWDRGEELRAFALTELPSGSFERIVAVLSSAEEPTWPVWVPGVRNSSPVADELVAREVAQILLSAQGQRFVVVTTDLLGQPITAYRIDSVEGEPPGGWFAPAETELAEIAN
jgi:hypothetical protein